MSDKNGDNLSELLVEFYGDVAPETARLAEGLHGMSMRELRRLAALLDRAEGEGGE